MNILLIRVQKMVVIYCNQQSASLHTDFLINWIFLRNHTSATYRFVVFYLNIIHHLVFVLSSSWRILYEWTLIHCFWKSKLKRLNECLVCCDRNISFLFALIFVQNVWCTLDLAQLCQMYTVDSLLEASN